MFLLRENIASAILSFFYVFFLFRRKISKQTIYFAEKLPGVVGFKTDLGERWTNRT